MKNNFQSIPENPERRRSIMILMPDSLEQLKSQPGGSELILNPQVCLLDFTNHQSSDLLHKLKNSGLFNANAVLIQSPYNPSDYAELTDSRYKFAEAKCIHFATLCGLLGARKLNIEQMELKTTDGSIKLEGNLDMKISAKVGTEAEQRSWNLMRQKINIQQEYAKAKPVLDQAQAYLQKHQWLSDPHMNSLIALRQEGISLKTHKFSLDLTTEHRKNLKILFSLGIPQYLTSIQGCLETVKKENYDFSLKIHVEFWN
ncbi:hypothetical protein PJF56_16635 [Roseofilum sp. BLCC_M91]|uniref:Uncharacterized protein n=1 Tax=Roseofilum halophilum BLCC-M91 TaxID=3022259 RepID=A0ABT7BMU9_9CYAN|nr:hypothetical protein [Roseofilum halophilum]MDJ1180490.1 hypothetical protein [Roseofilum halophilum BLCC-M91]